MDPGARPRFVLVYQDRRIPLPDGEMVIGRGLGCHIRLNAEQVSRQHVKLIVRPGKLIAENMSATTGTLLNGVKLQGGRSVGHGDTLQLGPRQIRIEVEDVAGAPAAVMPDDDISGDEEITRTDLEDRLSGSVVMPAQIDFHNCPKCRAKIAFADGQCNQCGYAWSAQHPSAVTSRVTLSDLKREPLPSPSSIPVVYSSEELTIDAVVTTMALDKAFVPSELLDPVNTACELTLLPDGIYAMNLMGTVTSVKSLGDATGPAGMTVAFSEMPLAARAWIERWLVTQEKTRK
jgi:pSer/pThr/pTyr-binding forkhead associated (FHA) protein